MAKAKRKAADRPVGHASYVKDPAKAPACSTCDETWPCKIWQRWTARPEHEEAERERARVREQIARWRPGLWAAEVAPGPSCVCGLRTEDTCQRHPRKET
ncbi:hypothetical protein [Streptomyces atriruber]|uniref:hypothetical protein n=1 Tax=Streptomyces atriruber TaxID=545121 RepID=UPI000A42FD48|nr:hypothetical protein [Streptomyces atriruber]